MSLLPYLTPQVWNMAGWTRFGEIGDGLPVISASGVSQMRARSSAATNRASSYAQRPISVRSGATTSRSASYAERPMRSISS